MFHLSRQADYGFILLAALGEVPGDEFVSLKHIASKKRLPYYFLSKILPRLVEAGLVESREGLHGGYRLAKAAQKITLAEALQALEKDLHIVDCDPCARLKECEAKSIWKAFEHHLFVFLKSHTVAELITKNSALPNVRFHLSSKV